MASFPKSDRDNLRHILAIYGVEAATEGPQAAFVKQHIEDLEASDNEAIARSGFVLKRAQEGFGLGYKVPLGLIAMGQALLGIDLAVSTPFIASNPAAMTAATLGAIYYGYQALSEEERAAFHVKISEFLSFGVELVKSLVEFCISTMNSLLDSDTLSQIKKYVAETAEALGVSLHEITGSLLDRVQWIASTAGSAAYNAGATVGSAAGSIVERGRSYFARQPDLKE